LYSYNLSSGFSVLRLVTDPLRSTSIPVGAIAWDQGRQWHQIRVLDDTERLEYVTPERRLLIKLLKEQLERWARSSAVPRSEGTQDPWTTQFWVAVDRVLTGGFRVDQPKALESGASADALELLFDTIVQPIRSAQRSRARMEGFINRALGNQLSRKLVPRFEIEAFAARQEHVMRGYAGDRGTILLEGVNLAARTARRDADALVSKLLRIDAAPSRTGSLYKIVGYVSSPGGLNGESDLRDWIRTMITPLVFDIVAEADQLQLAAANALAAVGSQGELVTPHF
jgi:hypothetical protein